MIIIGGGGHAKVLADIALLNKVERIVFWVDQPSGESLIGWPLEKRLDQASEPVIIGIGDNASRKRVAGELRADFTSLVHPSAILARSSSIGAGTVVMAGAIINPHSSIGQHAIINTGAVIDHDARIDDYVHISPNATLAGTVTVGEGSWVGAGATVIQGIKIGKWAIIGAGAVVIRDVPDYAVAVGNPAKIIKYSTI
jgi:sugar O-acyltransferase (sialic acid O-acetyltransferase NeuD family)